jgi:hypothetical protein
MINGQPKQTARQRGHCSRVYLVRNLKRTLFLSRYSDRNSNPF